MIWGTNKQPKKGLNIELTDLQYEYLHELVMFAYPNLFGQVCPFRMRT